MTKTMIVLFFLSICFVGINKGAPGASSRPNVTHPIVNDTSKNDSVQDKASCREIQGNEGCFLKFDRRCPGGQIVVQIVVKKNKTTIGHADYSKNPPSFDIDKTFARSMNESGIFLNHCINGSIVYHNCNGTPDDSTDFYCTNDTSKNGAPGSSSHVNVTHPIANDTSKNGLGVVAAVALVIGAVPVALFVRKCVKRRKPDNHEGNDTAMQPLNAVTEANQAAQA
ncbi:uncharacterized protein [Syngnathus scovelli]|uniref:uncharacterized protein isoform X2 n=1 Tax=Syngnathus scovelli TaxID=161590 RepID=UPI0021106F52|nr:uncharacterized protein LOC125983901 isoform X2 [Syngnathus scovelli]